MLRQLHGSCFNRGSTSTLVSAMILLMIVLMLMFKILYMYRGMYTSLTSGFEYMYSSLRNTMFIVPCSYGVGICIVGSRGNAGSLDPSSLRLILPSDDYPLIIEVNDTLLKSEDNMLVPTSDLKNMICKYGYGVLVSSSGNSITLTCSDFNLTYVNTSRSYPSTISLSSLSEERNIVIRPGYIATLNGVSVPVSFSNVALVEKRYTGSVESFLEEISSILDYTYVVIPIRTLTLLGSTGDEYKFTSGRLDYSVTLSGSLNVYHDNVFLLVIKLGGQVYWDWMSIYSISVSVNVDGVTGRWNPGFLTRYSGWVLEYPPAVLNSEGYVYPSVTKVFYALLPPGSHSISVSVTVRGDVKTPYRSYGWAKLTLSVEAWSLDFSRRFSDYNVLLVLGTGEKLGFIPYYMAPGGVYFVDMVYKYWSNGLWLNEYYNYLRVFKQGSSYWTRQFGYGWLIPSIVPKPSNTNPNPTLYWLEKLGASTNISIKYYVPSKAVLLATPGVYVDLGDKLILVNDTITYLDVDGPRDITVYVPYYLVFASNRKPSDASTNVTSLQAPLTFYRFSRYESYRFYLTGLFTWTAQELGVSEYDIWSLETLYYQNLYSVLMLLYVPRGSDTARIYSLKCYGVWSVEGRRLTVNSIHVGVNSNDVTVSPGYSTSCPYTTQTTIVNVYSSYKQLQDPVGYTAILLGKVQYHTSNTILLIPVKP